MSNKITLASRRRAREYAVQALYSWKLSKNSISDIEIQILEIRGTSNVDLIYFHEIYTGSIKYVLELDKLMLPYLTRQLKELGHIEHIVLWIALFELTKRSDIPYKVTINEAIELAKIFGAEKSYKFINGVLHKVVIEVFKNK